MPKTSKSKSGNARALPSARRRYGIGEWYGRLFTSLEPQNRLDLAKIQAQPKKNRPKKHCPFHGGKGVEAVCVKEGGVCSLRLYELDPATKAALPVAGEDGTLVTTCPIRFEDEGFIYRWVGETLLNHPSPVVVNEVAFLERESKRVLPGETEISSEDVGRIDSVLVHPSLEPFSWCALEIQAVYFSGRAMKIEFDAIRKWRGTGLPFPAAHRRPDFRSSGPKRLMPQLQVKVPTLRRWGRKMAVVIDRPFFSALGRMEEVKDVSNSDIAWFIVRYEERDNGAVLVPDRVALTTLERAVEGLTGGNPVALPEFEKRIRAKLGILGAHSEPI